MLEDLMGSRAHSPKQKNDRKFVSNLVPAQPEDKKILRCDALMTNYI